MEKKDKIQMGFMTDRTKQIALRDKADENGQKVVWILNQLLDYYLENGLPQNNKEGK